MRSPFPGMDPYIEARGLWADFHDKLIVEIDRSLSRTLPDRYVVRVGERSYIDYLDPLEGHAGRHQFKPDASIQIQWGDNAAAEQHVAAAIADEDPNAFVMHGVIEDEIREIFLEIHELDPERRLVTCIEVLSPTNKRFATAGWYQYERKRQVFLEGFANLVEIDLLRGGRRRSMIEAWPSSPYYLMALRKEQSPRCIVWPAHFAKPIPQISIPLASPDPDIHLALQPLVDEIYARSRYHRDIDYGKPLKPPLSSEELVWLQARLGERKAGM